MTQKPKKHKVVKEEVMDLWSKSIAEWVNEKERCSILVDIQNFIRKAYEQGKLDGFKEATLTKGE